jgi:hypothetical protein
VRGPANTRRANTCRANLLLAGAVAGATLLVTGCSSSGDDTAGPLSHQETEGGTPFDATAPDVVTTTDSSMASDRGAPTEATTPEAAAKHDGSMASEGGAPLDAIAYDAGTTDGSTASDGGAPTDASTSPEAGPDATPADASWQDATTSDASGPDGSADGASDGSPTNDGSVNTDSAADSAPADASSTCATNVFSDDFSGTSLDPCWQTLNGTPTAPLLTIYETGGALHLQAIPNQDGVWFQGSTKSLVYKLLTGRFFKITTTAHPRKRTDLTAAPTQALHVGGLMVRDPTSQGGSTENYLFIMVGSNESAQPGVEIKSTTNGASAYAEPVWSTPLAADLRICRLDVNFYLYKRPPGTSTWILANEQDMQAPVSRPDLPATVQVGLALNFSGGSNDLDVAFDAITLAPAAPASEADCTTD